jgi:hypothetical protein
MSHACEEQRQLLMAYVQEELQPLERARLESHLENCKRCNALKLQITSSLSAAKAWAPEVDPEHFEHLVRRLSPYLEQRQERSRIGFSLLLAGAVAAALLLVVSIRLGTLSPARDRDTSSATDRVVAAQPTPHIRMVTSMDWDGKVSAIDAQTSRITMTRGFGWSSSKAATAEGSWSVLQASTWRSSGPASSSRSRPEARAASWESRKAA